jgi:integrase
MNDQDREATNEIRTVRRARRREPLGVARVRSPVFSQRDGVWLARYVDLVGKERQAGRFVRKRDAAFASQEAVDTLNLRRSRSQVVPNLDDYLEHEWTQTFPRRERTDDTNKERIKRYVLPHLPAQGAIPLDVLSRSDLLAVQAALLKQRLSKVTIDGAFASLSALLRDCQSLGMIDDNPAKGLNVRPSDRRLDPARPGKQRRAVPLEELYAFFDVMEEGFPDYACLAWTPLVSGMRPGELFAADRREIDRQAQTIFVHETASKKGRLEAGTKTTHHVRSKERRGRHTLFPAGLQDLLAQQPTQLTPLLFPSPRGKVWNPDNFQARVWRPAMRRAGSDFTLYDLRHTFASRLLSAGIPLVEVSAWMGHRIRAGGLDVGGGLSIDSTTARTYAHGTGEWRAAALGELNAMIRRQTDAQRELPHLRSL